jgi:Na+-driven multidrug efflux pump
MLLTLAWVVPEYFVFLDLGLGRASSKYVAEALGREDKEHVSRFAWTAVIVQMVIGCLGALALIGLAPFLTDHLLNVSPTVASEAKVMFALAALSIPVVLVSNSFIGFLAAGQRFDLVNGVSVSFNLLSLLLTFLGVLYFDWNLNDIVAALVVGRVLTLGVYYRLCTHVFSSFRRVLPSGRAASSSCLRRVDNCFQCDCADIALPRSIHDRSLVDRYCRSLLFGAV